MVKTHGITHLRACALALVALVACDRCDAAPIDLAATCPAVLADTTLPGRPAAADALRVQGKAWTNRQIREMYICRVSRIAAEDAGWIQQALGPEARARKAYEVRHNARLTARAMMADRGEVAALEARDLEKYGHKDGPTWEWLVERAQKKGLSGDEVFLSIIESAQETSESVNKSLGL
jgi:hypothetical protein